MEMAELKELTEDKPQAVHQQQSHYKLGGVNEDVRGKASRGRKKVSLPAEVLEALPSTWVLPRVIHRPSCTTCSFEPQNASQALLLVLQAIKKPAVTCTSGQVMGELTIWPSS